MNDNIFKDLIDRVIFENENMHENMHEYDYMNDFENNNNLKNMKFEKQDKLTYNIKFSFHGFFEDFKKI